MATSGQDDPQRLPSSPSTPNTWHDIASSLYGELHRLAVGKMRFERGNHTLQSTALVNEAYLRLATCSDSMWQDRTRSIAAARLYLRGEALRHSLQPTALSHEVYLPLFSLKEVDRQSRSHFFAVSANGEYFDLQVK
jgi:hypothetical protein